MILKAAAAALLAVLLCSCRRETVEELASSVPKEIDGWGAKGEDRRFDRQTLFKYIDGGAELYLAYRFREVLVREYAKEGEAPVVLDIYDMERPEEAFGVFTAEREMGEGIGVGVDSEYSEGLLRFWKGRFFVSIFTPEPTDEGERFVRKLGRIVSDAIRETGSPPDLLSLLPGEGLIERSIRYFHKHTILNHFYYLSEGNILDLDMDVEAVLARYELEGGKPYLLVIRYPDEARAESAYSRFSEVYMPDSKGGAVQTEDGLWTACALRGKVIAVALDAPSRDTALRLTGKALRGLSKGKAIKGILR